MTVCELLAFYQKLAAVFYTKGGKPTLEVAPRRLAQKLR